MVKANASKHWFFLYSLGIVACLSFTYFNPFMINFHMIYSYSALPYLCIICKNKFY